jgi:hypothetical protein
MKRILLFSSGLALGLTLFAFVLANFAAAQKSKQVPEADVISKSIKAVGYTVGGGSTKVVFVGTTAAPSAIGEAKVGAKKSGTDGQLHGEIWFGGYETERWRPACHFRSVRWLCWKTTRKKIPKAKSFRITTIN